MFKIGEFSKWLGEKGVNVVASTYTYAWGELAHALLQQQGYTLNPF